MVEEIAKDIYRIGVRLPNNPLRELNSYLIKGTNSDLLIDTGFRCEVCKQDIFNGIKEIGSDIENIDVALTHYHSDHNGLAMECAGKQKNIYLSELDFEGTKFELTNAGREERNRRFLEEGFPAELLTVIDKENPAINYMLAEIDHRFTTLCDGEKIQVGEHVLEMILVPGHTPGNAMYWMEKEQIMFTGDHVLFGISPNIICSFNNDDSLGNYLESLKKVQNYPVKLALPGHRETGHYEKRIDTLLMHHSKRLEEIQDIIEHDSGITAYQIAGKMQWKIHAKNWEEFPVIQKWYAVGECLAHLDHLRKSERILRKKRDEVWYYYLKQI